MSCRAWLLGQVCKPSVSRNRGSKMKGSKAADKMSVSGVIQCSTQGHDLDQELVMEHEQT